MGYTKPCVRLIFNTYKHIYNICCNICCISLNARGHIIISEMCPLHYLYQCNVGYTAFCNGIAYIYISL